MHRSSASERRNLKLVLVLLGIGVLQLAGYLFLLDDAKVVASKGNSPCWRQYFTVKNVGWRYLALDQYIFSYYNENNRLPARGLFPGEAVRVWRREGVDDVDDIYFDREGDWSINGLSIWRERAGIRGMMSFFMGEDDDRSSVVVFCDEFPALERR